MRAIMLASAAALLSFAGVSGMAMAQDMPPPDEATPPSTTMQPPADPNAGQPTGAVPPDTGMVPAPADVPSDPTVPVGSAANPVTVGGNMTPPPAEAKDYPSCSRTVQDNCVNPGEKAR